MRSTLILAIFVIFVFASCHSDIPGLPSPDEVKFCRYEDGKGVRKCKSTYEISEKECGLVGGTVLDNADSCP